MKRKKQSWYYQFEPKFKLIVEEHSEQDSDWVGPFSSEKRALANAMNMAYEKKCSYEGHYNRLLLIMAGKIRPSVDQM